MNGLFVSPNDKESVMNKVVKEEKKQDTEEKEITVKVTKRAKVQTEVSEDYQIVTVK
jgi:hypothetical protein